MINSVRRQSRHRIGAALRLAAAVTLLSSVAVAEEVEDIDDYQDPDSVSLAPRDVPENIMAVVDEARPGLYITRITRDLESDDDYYYRFEGSQVGRYWTVVVRSDGTLVKTREQDDPIRQRSD